MKLLSCRHLKRHNVSWCVFLWFIFSLITSIEQVCNYHVLTYGFLTTYTQGLQQIFCENQPTLYLVSHGAECVMLNKKFYKDHVDANMAQRLKQKVCRRHITKPQYVKCSQMDAFRIFYIKMSRLMTNPTK